MKEIIKKYFIFAAILVFSSLAASAGVRLDKNETGKTQGAAKKYAKNDLTGKYVYQGKQGETFYEFVLELKAKNVASYKAEYTGGTGEKTGVWNFDEKKKLLTVKFDNDFVIVLKQVGKNLEVVKKSEDEDPIYGRRLHSGAN